MDDELSKLKRERELDPEAVANKEAYDRAKRRELPKRELLDDITMLFEPDFDAYLVTVHGLALGDPVSKIPKALVTHGFPNPLNAVLDPDMGPNPGVLRIKKKGETDYRPYPPDEAYQDILDSGSAYLCLQGPTGPNDIAIHIQSSIIQKISICNDLVSSLNITTEEEMYEKWGRIDRYRRHDGDSDFALPKRHLCISWDDWTSGNTALSTITLGQVSEDQVPLITAQDLILWTLEWRIANLAMRPNFEELDEADSVRLQRIYALFDALDIFEPDEANLVEFFEGRIFQNRCSILSEQLPRKLNDVKFDFDLSQYNHVLSETDCRIFWLELYKLLFRLQAARSSIDGHFDEIDCSPLQTGLYNYRESIATKLEEEYETVLQIMAFMIDPAERSFTWGFLVRRHHFPDEDLQDLDDDRPIDYSVQRIQSRLADFEDWDGND